MQPVTNFAPSILATDVPGIEKPATIDLLI
jgi:hypothetical protein